MRKRHARTSVRPQAPAARHVRSPSSSASPSSPARSCWATRCGPNFDDALHRGQRGHRRRRPQRRDDRRPTTSRSAGRRSTRRSSTRSRPSTASPPSAPSVEGYGQILGKDGERSAATARPRSPATGSRTRSSTRTGWPKAARPAGRTRSSSTAARPKDGDLHVGDTTTVLDARAGHPVDDRRHRHVRRRGRPGRASRYAFFTLDAAAAVSCTGPTAR